MANPICISPLKFYDGIDKQCHNKSYAYNHVSPLVGPLFHISAFQFVLGSIDGSYSLKTAELYRLDSVELKDIKSSILEAGLTIIKSDGYYVVIYKDLVPVNFLSHEGQYFLKLSFSTPVGIKEYYSEVFCVTSSLSDCLQIEYWNATGNFHIKNGVIVFPSDFHFKIYLKSELGKPEYGFEEEGTKRLGYTFIESQVSKKTYRFNSVVPEFICDAMRIIRMCSEKIIRSKGNEYEAITFEIETEWQTQGDLASVTCEFDTDNIILNLGGLLPAITPDRGDFNEDFNEDYKIE